jgi:hypothetical protein
MGREWVRPYTPSRGRLVVAAWEAGALASLQRSPVDLFHLEPVSVPLAVALFVLWVALCWRLAVLGVYTSPRGVLIRGLLTRRTIAWADIQRITVDDSSFTVGRRVVPLGRAIRFDMRDGTRVNSTLHADGIDFRFRRHLFKRLHEELRRRHSLATDALLAWR